jgi:N-dimethylarginine dimethylaminohydrolase
MCPPTYFEVSYAINAWMDPAVPVDRQRAIRQWSELVAAYRAVGHRVDELTPVEGLPDMVFAANGATVVDGRVLLARFVNPQRAAEAAVHAAWHRGNAGSYRGREVRLPAAVNEGEGDFAVLSDRILAGYGFRTSLGAHQELARLTGRPVISLELVDPHFYHLDVALTVLDDRRDQIAYYPGAFSPASRRRLARLFPDALIATEQDAYAFGLNGVSDGLHVFIPTGAPALTGALVEAGYRPVPIDLSELIKAGGSVRCCTQEIRPGAEVRQTGHRAENWPSVAFAAACRAPFRALAGNFQRRPQPLEEPR